MRKAARTILKVIWWSILLAGAVMTLGLLLVEGYAFIAILTVVIGE